MLAFTTKEKKKICVHDYSTQTLQDSFSFDALPFIIGPTVWQYIIDHLWTQETIYLILNHKDIISTNNISALVIKKGGC